VPSTISTAARGLGAQRVAAPAVAGIDDRRTRCEPGGRGDGRCNSARAHRAPCPTRRAVEPLPAPIDKPATVAEQHAVPGYRRRGDALRTEARAAVEMVLGTAAWLVVAGLVEGFLTPAGLGLPVVITVGVDSRPLLGARALARAPDYELFPAPISDSSPTPRRSLHRSVRR